MINKVKTENVLKLKPYFCVKCKRKHVRGFVHEDHKIYDINMHFLTEYCQIQIENRGDVNEIYSE